MHTCVYLHTIYKLSLFSLQIVGKAIGCFVSREFLIFRRQALLSDRKAAKDKNHVTVT